jgi:hypothetical protein
MLKASRGGQTLDSIDISTTPVCQMLHKGFGLDSVCTVYRAGNKESKALLKLWER